MYVYIKWYIYQIIIIILLGLIEFINIARLDFDNLNTISNTKSNIWVKGITIDCKAFEAYGDIICVLVGYDDCNLNVYKKEVPNDYSEALLQ